MSHRGVAARRATPMVTAIIVAVALCLLVTPISMAALVDLIRFMRGN